MGFLPVLVVLIGSLVLWTMIGYSSLSRYKGLAIDSEKEAQILKHELIMEVNGFEEFEPQFKANLVQQLEMLQSQNMDQLLDKIQSVSDNKSKEEGSIDFQFLASVTKRLSKQNDLMRIHKSAVKSFNALIKEKPTSFIAYLFGFKPI